MKTRTHLHAEISHWESAYETLAFTVDALGAALEDAELARLHARVSAQLADWEAIERDRRKLRRAVVNATARTRVADARLDVALGAFASDLIGLVGNDTSSATYTKFFPIPHEEVIALGLDAELPMVTLILGELDRGNDTPELLGHHAGALRSTLQLGNSALAARSDALADVGRHGGRMDAWLDGAEITLRSLHHTLQRIANERHYPGTFVEAFFA